MDENWLGGGAPMWWSHADADTNRSWLTGAGFTVEHEEFTFPVASGIVAGGSLMGVVLVLWANGGSVLGKLLGS